MGLKGFQLGLLAGAVSIFSLACGSRDSSAPVTPIFPPTYEGPAELAYCSSPVAYSNPVTITGTANYEYRLPFNNGVGNNNRGLGAVEASKRPIRRAEVRVLNSSGGVAQCAETDANGDFSFTLPTSSASYTIQVNSRANNSHLVATVFNSPEQKQFYSLTTTVTGASSTSVGTLTAKATGDLLGGAFNILDQLLNANEYLRTQAGNCGIAGCIDFTVTPKIEVFWAKGFNPGSYYNSGPLSFYLPGYGRLFILGGVNGDTDVSDTDHYDNSIIIHEFGHFLEDKVFVSDSPGGSHNGNKIIDPRLAWSEGWGNFIQAAVQNSPYYIDTIGNLDGTTNLAFYVDLEDNTNPDYDEPIAGPGGSDGEGNFREFSVTRFLWDVIDNVNDGENISGGFAEIWATLTRYQGGFRDPDAEFRSVGWFHYIQDQILNITDWSSLRSLEKHVGDRSEYAQYVTVGGCGTGYNFSILPVNVLGDGGSFSTSDLFRNNNFYHYYNAGTLSNVMFRMQYQDQDASGTVADLDLFIYNSSARFGVSSDIVAKSQLEPSGGAGAVQTETVTISSLPAGHYLINVFVYTGGAGVGGLAEYKIQRSTDGGNNWTNLCAGNVP